MRIMDALTPAERNLSNLLAERARIDAQINAAMRELEQRPAGKRSRHVIPECGSESAYQRHRHYGEPQDEACREAHRIHNRVAQARRRKRTREAS